MNKARALELAARELTIAARVEESMAMDTGSQEDKKIRNEKAKELREAAAIICDLMTI